MPSWGWRNQETQANTSDLPPIGGFNHIQSIFSVYPHRDPYPPSNAQGYAVRRHDDAVLRGTVGAEDDGARVVIHIQLVPPPVCVDKVMVGYIPLVPQMLPSKPDFHLS